MTDNFRQNTCSAQDWCVQGMLEFDIPVHGDNRGWFKESFQKEKMYRLVFLKSSLLKESPFTKTMSAFLIKMFFRYAEP